jgi:hypothetical protein
VRPTLRAGKLLLPMERSGADGVPVQVELTYVSADSFPQRRGTVRLASPALDIPLKNARWELYLPPHYVFDQFEGSMKRQLAALPFLPTALEDAAAPQRASFFYSLADYAQVEGDNRAKRDAAAATSINAARSNIVGGNLVDAKRALDNARNNWNQDSESNKEEFKKLEKDIRRAQGKQMIEQQRQYTASNAMVLNGPVPNASPTVQGARQQVELDELAAEQQAEKVQKAQEIVTVQAMPLRVNLPKRGQQLVFAQTLQTELRKPMTVQFRAVQTTGLGWPAAVGLGLAAFGLLWGAAALWLRRRAA